MSTQAAMSSNQASTMQAVASASAPVASSTTSAISQAATSFSTSSDPKLCSICLDNIDLASDIITKCAHHYHRNCLNTWLSTKNVCPMCRTSDPLQTNSNQGSNSQIENGIWININDISGRGIERISSAAPHDRVNQVAMRIFSSLNIFYRMQSS